MYTMLLITVVALSLASSWVRCQNNPAFNDPNSQNVATNLFFFDKNSDCNNPKRDIYNAEATIRGSDISTTQRGPTSCEIILISERPNEIVRLEIQVISMNIQDCSVQVSIYEGEGPQEQLSSYDCRSSFNQNTRRFVTTGNVATFVMTRENTASISFDIEIRVRPVRGGSNPGWENNYNRDNPFGFDKFDQEAIVGIVGGFYGLVFLICCAVVIYWYRTFNGLNKEWETHQLAALKTGSVFGATNPTTAPSQAWSVSLQPTQSRMGPSSQMSRKRGPPSEDWDSTGVYNEERFESRRLTTEREGARPRYATTNFSYSDREDDDPDHFVEKVITPRPRAINRRRETRSSRPPSYTEAVSDDTSHHSSEDEYSSDASVAKKSLSSQEENSHSSRSSGSESETQSESEDSRDGSESSSSQRRRRQGRERGARARKPPPAVKPPKSRGKMRRDSSNTSDAGSNSTRPSRRQQPHHHQPPPMAMGHVPYGAPGQFVPVMAAPMQMMPSYPPPHYHQPEMQHDSRPSQRPQVQPTEPPVYSYLVQRGYTPLDQLSAASQASTQESQRLEEPDTRLSSGVDYMRR